jgi:hypothetical protein
MLKITSELLAFGTNIQIMNKTLIQVRHFHVCINLIFSLILYPTPTLWAIKYLNQTPVDTLNISTCIFPRTEHIPTEITDNIDNFKSLQPSTAMLNHSYGRKKVSHKKTLTNPSRHVSKIFRHASRQQVNLEGAYHQ